ncbi:hypothetical protein FKM82_016250 [Ascaphus truei]
MQEQIEGKAINSSLLIINDSGKSTAQLPLQEEVSGSQRIEFKRRQSRYRTRQTGHTLPTTSKRNKTTPREFHHTIYQGTKELTA